MGHENQKGTRRCLFGFYLKIVLQFLHIGQDITYDRLEQIHDKRRV